MKYKLPAGSSKNVLNLFVFLSTLQMAFGGQQLPEMEQR